MKRLCLSQLTALVICLLPMMAAIVDGAPTPSVKEALSVFPIQQGVNFDRPQEAQMSQCKILPQKMGGKAGWVVSGPSGAILRKYVDTNGDGTVDQWSYYSNGLEVYRDIDGSYNKKTDQYRWFHTGGSRWGIDRDEDGVIDQWKTISAEEVTAEVVAALAQRDAKRFARLCLTSKELKSLGLGTKREEKLAEKLAKLADGFQTVGRQQNAITSSTSWVQFSGNRPGIIPSGTGGSTRDLQVYENVVAIVETNGKHGQVQIGTLVKLGDVWRVVDIPQPIVGKDTQLSSSGFFFRAEVQEPSVVASTDPNEATQKMLAELEQIDVAAAKISDPQQLAKFNARRADLLEQIAEQHGPAERSNWLKQLADMVSAAVQSGRYPEGVGRLEALYRKLAREKDEDLSAYVRFRHLSAEYGLVMKTATQKNFQQLQSDWLEKLEKYVTAYPSSPDTAEAILQIAIANEFAGNEQEALRWYSRVAKEFPKTSPATKAAGAKRRLESVGKALTLSGKNAKGGTIDLNSYRGKVVLIQYWSTWCGPCKADMATIRGLLGKYGKSGFSVIGVNLDTNVEDFLSYMKEAQLPWPQIYEEGGLESRPANEMGILTLPMMILINQKGQVVNRNIHAAEVDVALRQLIR